MQKKVLQVTQIVESMLPWIILIILLAYTYAFFLVVPYSGFFFNPATGEIVTLYVKPASGNTLAVGDIISRIGPVARQSYVSNATQTLFNNTKPGDVVDMVVERAGKQITIPWTLPGVNQQEFRNEDTKERHDEHSDVRESAVLVHTSFRWSGDHNTHKENQNDRQPLVGTCPSLRNVQDVGNSAVSQALGP